MWSQCLCVPFLGARSGMVMRCDKVDLCPSLGSRCEGRGDRIKETGESGRGPPSLSTHCSLTSAVTEDIVTFWALDPSQL